MGLRRPRRPVLGSELAGVVEAVGDGVSGFQTGDRVFALTGMALGAHAEFCLVKADGAVAHSPPNLSDREVAPLAWAGGTALYFLRDLGQLRRGERALIIGAAGGVGSAAVQIAAHLGAQVTGVCRGDNAALVRDLGAHAIIDYERESFQNLAARYDLILDTVGECSWSNSRGALAPGGRLLLAVADLWQTLGAVIWPRRAGQQVRAGTTPERADDLRLLAQWASEGALRPHIDRVLPLSEIAQAHALVESRRKRGHIIIEP
jgi:NADPH:quinone reductase-like Zn-dependent oxidoreductase